MVEHTPRALRSPGPMLEFLRGRDVLVAGWGVSGRSLIEPLRDIGARPVVTDAGEKAMAEASELGLDTATGAALLEPGALDRVRAGRSPVRACGRIRRCWSRRSPRASRSGAMSNSPGGSIRRALYGPVRKWLVVTGTNGKTTTTSMTGLDSATPPGWRVVACGNIGLPILDALRRTPRPQSTSLSNCRRSNCTGRLRCVRRPGVVLNVAEDHLDWHGGMDAYADAKARALTGRVAVVGLDDAVAAALARKSQGAPHRRVPDGGARAKVNWVWSTGNCSIDAFGQGRDPGRGRRYSPHGPAGVTDALAAAALARAIGCRARSSSNAAWPNTRSARTEATVRVASWAVWVHRRFQGHQSACGPVVDHSRTTAWSGSPAVCSRAPMSTI